MNENGHVMIVILTALISLTADCVRVVALAVTVAGMLKIVMRVACRVAVGILGILGQQRVIPSTAQDPQCCTLTHLILWVNTPLVLRHHLLLDHTHTRLLCNLHINMMYFVF